MTFYSTVNSYSLQNTHSLSDLYCLSSLFFYQMLISSAPWEKPWAVGSQKEVNFIKCMTKVISTSLMLSIWGKKGECTGISFFITSIFVHLCMRNVLYVTTDLLPFVFLLTDGNIVSVRISGNTSGYYTRICCKYIRADDLILMLNKFKYKNYTLFHFLVISMFLS